MRSRGGISERYMEFLRGKVVMSAIDTYKEDVIPVPTSRTEELAMLIHEIVAHTATPTMQAGAVTLSSWHVADRALDHTKNVFEPGILAYGMNEANDLPAGLLSYAGYLRICHFYFDPPILYAKASIYFGIETEGEAAPQWGMCRIGYTLEKVSKDAFIAALIE